MTQDDTAQPPRRAWGTLATAGAAGARSRGVWRCARRTRSRPLPTPAVLGLAYQQPWTRPEVPHGPETRAQRWARARESAVWGQVLSAIGRPPAGATWISVSDRESDVFGFLREAKDLGWQCLLRLCQALIHEPVGG